MQSSILLRGTQQQQVILITEAMVEACVTKLAVGKASETIVKIN